MSDDTHTPGKLSKSEKIIIIGAGVFGLSTALELRTRGYEKVTVLDRYMPPVPDGASVDVSRMVRFDYPDEFYAQLGYEALQGWERDYAAFFRKSGFVITSESPGHVWIQKAKATLVKFGHSVIEFDALKEYFPEFDGEMAERSGYFNESCGWANAAGAIGELARRCTDAGVSFITGDEGTATSIVSSEGALSGVQVKSGNVLSCTRAIVSTGPWINYLIDLHGAITPTGQPIIHVQLSPEEAKELANVPMAIDMSSGVFVFPPTKENRLKVGRHGYGYETSYNLRHENPQSGLRTVSGPKEDSNNVKNMYIPDDAAATLRAGLARYYPRFKDRPFVWKRLCWYTDSVDGNFVVDNYHPIPGLFIASGGSGHSFKFLPVLGQRIVDIFEGVASERDCARWAYKPADKPLPEGGGTRGGPARRFLTEQEQSKI